jgi:hypothetical protein
MTVVLSFAGLVLTFLVAVLPVQPVVLVYVMAALLVAAAALGVYELGRRVCVWTKRGRSGG